MKTEFDKCIRNLVSIAKFDAFCKANDILLPKRQLSPLENACEQHTDMVQCYLIQATINDTRVFVFKLSRVKIQNYYYTQR